MKRLNRLYVIPVVLGFLILSSTSHPLMGASLWQGADHYDNGWSSLPWFGYFSELDQNWIYHLEHGYQYCLGNDTSSYYFHDQSMKSWFWSSANVYPHIYKYGANSGWYWYYKGGQPQTRWFNRIADGTDLLDADINTGPPPQGFTNIPRGIFTMGSPVDEPGATAAETQHQVTMTRRFYMQSREVTLDQWEAVQSWAFAHGYTNLPLGRPGYLNDNSRSQPVTDVSWYDVVRWLNAWSENEGLTPCYTVDGGVYRNGDLDPICDFDANGYRLPTEAEWEYACRAGTQTAFYSGDITEPGNSLVDPSLNAIGWYQFHGSNTHQGGGKQPNAFGLYDMSGNVSEWCWDWFWYYDGDVTDPTGPSTGAFRIVRGGSTANAAADCRSAARGYSNPSIRGSFRKGFRAARTP